MKIINAIWEKRNLGVDCKEIQFDTEDTVEEAREAIKQLDTEYQTIRVPSGKTELLLLAQEHGFQVIELSIHMSKKLESVKLPQIYKRFESHISIEAVTDIDMLNEVLNEVRGGEMFITDKIALDPFFSPKLAGQRYSFWIQDLLSNGGQLSIARYHNDIIGFCLNIKKTEKIYDAALGGIYNRFKNKGLGFVTLYGNLLTAYQQGCRTITTTVSSNNLPILRLHQFYGFETTGITYILIKHK